MSIKLVWLICAKDLKIEMRSRVVLFQVVPFAVLTLILFAFAFEADRPALRQYAPGLFWVTILLASLLFVLRSFEVEVEQKAADNLRLSAINPSLIFLGKALALFIGILALSAILWAFAFLFYDISVDNPALLICAGILGSAAIASAATLYGVLSASLKAKETILPLLMLPVLIPVFLGTIRTFDDALGSAAVNGWAWLSLLGAFAFVYSLMGSLLFGSLLEEV